MIIGISGLAGSGKDTCADFLVRDHGFVKVALADPIKRMTAEAFGFSYEQLWGASSERNKPDERYPRSHGPIYKDGRCACCGHSLVGAFEREMQCYLTPRFALQRLGTEWGRGCYDNVWVEYAVRVAEVLSDGRHYYDPSHRCNMLYEVNHSTPSSVVIPDVRFKNEIDGLRAHGAKLIRVVRPSAGLAGAAGQHTSETEQASIPDSVFDTVIQNAGTVADLGEAVNRALFFIAEK